MDTLTPPAPNAFASTRADLESEQPRQRLAAINKLCRLVSEGKRNQQAVGAFLRDASLGKRLLEIVLADLQTADRTLRCAAARLVCQLAVENLVNQESIIQLSKGGFSVGWLYVFSVPPAYEAETQCGSRAQLAQRSRSSFLQELVANAYGEVYAKVSTYYASACASFLALCWHYPAAETDDRDVVPDPADHLLGFFLVPRQTQFPERDEFYHNELIKSLDDADLVRLQTVKDAYDKCASENDDLVAVDTFLTSVQETSLEWLIKALPSVAPLSSYNESSCPATLTWNHVFVYATMRLNSETLATTFDRSALDSISSLFRELAFTTGDCINGTTYVWLPVLITAVQRNPDLPAPFKKQVQSLQRGITGFHDRHDEPWRVLLHTKLDQVVPVSWAVFLAQWRIALTLEKQLVEHPKQDAVAPRRTSVCSVGDIRKSIVATMQSRSFRDLGTSLQREEFQSQQELLRASMRLPSFHTPVTTAEEDASSDDDDDPLTQNLALFHRMQQSLAELDALGMKKREERERDKQRLRETVAMNKQHVQDQSLLKRLLLDKKHQDFAANRTEMERRNAAARAKAREEQQRKHALAAQRKQEHDAALEAKQQELAREIEERDAVCQENLRRLRQEFDDERRERSTCPRPPSAAHKRPLSAHRPRAKVTETPSPDVLRQRALLYGHVVSKIYVADAASRAPPADAASPVALHQPHHLMRSFSVFRNSSFNVKAPVVKIAPPPSRRPRSPRPRRTRRPVSPPSEETVDHDDNDNDHEQEEDDTPTRRTHRSRGSSASKEKADSPLTPGHANACATLVMRNAALAVADRILIPDVPAPHVDEPPVPPYVIAAQYEALDDQHKRHFRERFNLKCVSHRLSYDVLQQYTKIVRRDMAWQAFHDRCGHASERIKYMEFVAVAQSLGAAMNEKRLLVTARQLDPRKSGFVEWKAFYTWWSLQYSHGSDVTPTRPKTVR